MLSAHTIRNLTIASTLALIPSVFGAESEPLKFNRDIRPILSNNCFTCHGPDTKKVKAGLQLHSREVATAPIGESKDRHPIVPGDRNASELWARITADSPEDRMPPAESNHRLSTSEIQMLGRWIDEGAKFEGHWSFQPINTESEAEGSIDEFIPSTVGERWIAVIAAR